MNDFRILNTTMELADLRDKWTFDGERRIWCLEDVLYTPRARVPAFQRLSIYVPAPYMSAPGAIDPAGAFGRWTAKTAPVIFENNSAGYMQMPHTWPGGPRWYGDQYLEKGCVYVTAGCRGHESVDEAGVSCGKSPMALIDLKTAIRFLRHNRAYIPGTLDKLVSVGWSAGGAMSTLLGVTGNAPELEAYLAENGAFMDERDDVFAAQIYCPIIDLEHADAAYEWCFGADDTDESGHTLTAYERALSEKLRAAYIPYFNSLGLRDPATGAALTLDETGRGPAYDYLMKKLSDSATKHLRLLEEGRLDKGYTAAQYLAGDYTYRERGLPPRRPEEHSERHQAGAGGLGMGLLRPLDGTPSPMMMFGPHMVEKQGKDKRTWLTWDGERATVSDLDTYVLNHRSRKKVCPSFDDLELKTPENSEMGSPEKLRVHFGVLLAEAVKALAEEYPEETARYGEALAQDLADPGVRRRVDLINPLRYIREEKGEVAKYFRIRVGASDADTSFTMSMTLALMLANRGLPVDYELVWDEPHTEADYPGEVTGWIADITK